jgi:hypothetical protein
VTAEFEDNAHDGPDLETVRSIAADMANAGKPVPPTEAERAEWRAWREQQALLANEQRLECARRRAEAAAEQEREARRQAAIARSERNERLQAEKRQQSARQMRDRQLSDLHQASIRSERFRQGMMRSAAHSMSQQQLSEALDSWMAMKYPPPPPEPTVVVVSEDYGSADLGSRNFDVAKWARKPRSWW